VVTIRQSLSWELTAPLRLVHWALARLLRSARNGAEGCDLSPLFDTDWYLSKNPDVAAAGVNPLAHYLAHGASEGRDPNPLFDSDWYLSTNPDVAAAGVNPLAHYVSHGASEGRDPDPLFDSDWYLSTNPDVVASGVNPLAHYLAQGASQGRDPNPLFDSDWYLSTNPDVAAAGVNPLAHYLAHGASERRDPSPLFDALEYLGLATNQEGAQPMMNPLTDYLAKKANNSYSRRISHRASAIKTAAGAVRHIGALDPELLVSIAPSKVAQLRILNGHAKGRAYAGWRRLFRSLDRTYDRMIFVPSFPPGGAEVVAVNALKVAHQKHGSDSTLFVVTDHNDMSAKDWLPPGTHFRVLSELVPTLTLEERVEIVTALVYHLQPKAILTIQSASVWEAIALRGAALSNVTNCYGFLFSRGVQSDGRVLGHADRYLRACLPHLRRVYFDSRSFEQRLLRDYGIPPSLRTRFSVIYQPPREELASRVRGAGIREARPSRVLWAGRIAPEKNLALVAEVVRRLPEVDFDIYGAGDQQYVRELSKQFPSNASFKGSYLSFSDIPFERYTAFLYTTLYDGLPNVLIEVGRAKLPMVAPNVGGIGELIDAETGWLIKDTTDPTEYVLALEMIEAELSEITRRTGNMSKKVADRHSWDAYVQSISAPPSFLD